MLLQNCSVSLSVLLRYRSQLGLFILGQDSKWSLIGFRLGFRLGFSDLDYCCGARILQLNCLYHNSTGFVLKIRANLRPH